VNPGAMTLGFGYDGPLLTSIAWGGPVTGSIELEHDDDFRVVQEEAGCRRRPRARASVRRGMA
jgi:hypothetical protein